MNLPTSAPPSAPSASVRSRSPCCSLACALRALLFDLGRACYVLDGKLLCQDVSNGISRHAAGRAENLHKGARVARQLNHAGLIAIGAFTAPTEESRAQARHILGD